MNLVRAARRRLLGYLSMIEDDSSQLNTNISVLLLLFPAHLPLFFVEKIRFSRGRSLGSPFGSNRINTTWYSFSTFVPSILFFNLPRYALYYTLWIVAIFAQGFLENDSYEYRYSKFAWRIWLKVWLFDSATCMRLSLSF